MTGLLIALGLLALSMAGTLLMGAVIRFGMEHEESKEQVTEKEAGTQTTPRRERAIVERSDAGRAEAF